MSAPDEVTAPNHKTPIEQLIEDVAGMRQELRQELRDVLAASERAETAAQRAADETMRLRVAVQRHDDWINSFDRRYFWLPLGASLAAFALSLAALVLVLATLPR